MKGYKGMNKYMICKGFPYELGETYTFDGKIWLCFKGFHFSKDLIDVFDYYSPNDSGNRFFEVEASGDIIEGMDKCVTSKIKIIRELPRVEVYRTFYGNGCGLKNEYEGRYRSGNGVGYGYQDGPYCGYGNGGDKYGYASGNGHGYGLRFIGIHGSGCGNGCGGFNIQQVLKLK